MKVLSKGFVAVSAVARDPTLSRVTVMTARDAAQGSNTRCATASAALRAHAFLHS